MENTGFNQGQYSRFTPEVTKEHNGNVIAALLITALAITAGVIIYTLVNQKINEERNNKM